jgi:hypothetical protein
MVLAVGEPEYPIYYSPQRREFMMWILDGGESGLRLPACPFCGARLPLSLRSIWFERVDGVGLEPGDPAIPDELTTDLWWRRERISDETGDPSPYDGLG